MDFYGKINKCLCWDNLSRFLRVVEVIAIVCGVVFGLIQISEIKNNLDSREIEFVRSYSKDLFSGPNNKIFLRIDEGKPVLLKNGGPFTEDDLDDLDDYLGYWNGLSYPVQQNLIKPEFLCNEFSYGLEKISKNEEIRGYLEEIRKEDDSYFGGLDNLIDVCQ